MERGEGTSKPGAHAVDEPAGDSAKEKKTQAGDAAAGARLATADFDDCLRRKALGGATREEEKRPDDDDGAAAAPAAAGEPGIRAVDEPASVSPKMAKKAEAAGKSSARRFSDHLRTKALWGAKKASKGVASTDTVDIGGFLVSPEPAVPALPAPMIIALAALEDGEVAVPKAAAPPEPTVTTHPVPMAMISDLEDDIKGHLNREEVPVIDGPDQPRPNQNDDTSIPDANQDS